MSLTFAQETDFNGDADFSEEEFRQKVDSVFQYMEYQGVDTGILIEHGFNFLNPRVFNGQNYVAKHFFRSFFVNNFAYSQIIIIFTQINLI